jgi:iron complex transport system substrate-binding protein
VISRPATRDVRPATRDPRTATSEPRTATRGLIALLALFVLFVGLSAQSTPARLVSTSPSITETLFALGLGDRVVGVSTYCWYPTQVSKLPKVGTYLKPEPETIARLKPDLVFLQAGPHATASQLASIGVKTATVDSGSLAKVFTTIKGIAAAAGVADRADKLNAELNAALDRVKAAVAGKTPKKVLIVVGRQTGTLSDIVAVGPGSYLHDIAAIAGGQNVLAESKIQYARISMETVIALTPDIIIDIGEMGEFPTDSTERLKVTENLWKRQTLVKAVREGAIHASNDQAFVVPGPRIVLVARMMASWFHGVSLK